MPKKNIPVLKYKESDGFELTEDIMPARWGSNSSDSEQLDQKDSGESQKEGSSK